MKIEFNKQNIEKGLNKDKVTKYVIIGGLTALLAVVSYQGMRSYNGTSRKETSNNKKVEEKVTYDVSGYPGYHLEGENAVKDVDSIRLERVYEKILSGEYALVKINDKICVKIEDNDVKDATIKVDNNGHNYFSAEKYPGYALVGDKAVKTTTEIISIDEIIKAGYHIVDEDGQRYAVAIEFYVVESDRTTSDGHITYDLNAYPGYILVGDKGVKLLVEKIPIENLIIDDEVMTK